MQDIEYDACLFIFVLYSLIASQISSVYLITNMGVITNIYKASAIVIILGGASAIYVFLRKRNRSQKGKPRKAVEAFNYLNINIVTTVEDCDHVIHELRKRSMKHKTLGFDCEWVSDSSGRQPVALLQLSSFDGYCGLFRLNYFNGIMPNSLKELLQCEDVYKIGVAPDGDAKYIRSDYQTIMRAVLDVRYIAEMWGYKAGGLNALSEALLNVTLDKRWRIRCSNWEADVLTPTQIHYAASDAHAAIQIFVTLMEAYNKGRFWSFRSSHEDVWEKIDEICWQYSDLNYKTKQINNRPCIEGNKNDRKRKEKESRKQYRAHSTRSKPLYHNCYLQAPDGDLLCTCDTKKALWYVEKDLAVLISKDPLTVRLRFEPAGRSNGDVGKYYQMKKENQCVVCGATNSYIRKNIVPREYRKYFPEIMKDHSSHDILLLCVPCHQRSNTHDQVKRRHLAEICDAPIAHENPKVIEDTYIKKVRMAARALLVHGRKHSLPTERRKELEAVVLSHYVDQDEVTDSMLQEASTMQRIETNEDFTAESHGFRVVSKYLAAQGGLLKLEEEWRRHFLSTMRPMFMPKLWSVQHNKDRLKVKWDEKRLSANELKAIGVEW